jgi:hypothetical protein
MLLETLDVAIKTMPVLEGGNITRPTLKVCLTAEDDVKKEREC